MKDITITEIESMIKEKGIKYTVIDDRDFDQSTINKDKKTKKLAINFNDDGIVTGYNKTCRYITRAGLLCNQLLLSNKRSALLSIQVSYLLFPETCYSQ